MAAGAARDPILAGTARLVAEGPGVMCHSFPPVSPGREANFHRAWQGRGAGSNSCPSNSDAPGAGRRRKNKAGRPDSPDSLRLPADSTVDWAVAAGGNFDWAVVDNRAAADWPWQGSRCRRPRQTAKLFQQG